MDHQNVQSSQDMNLVLSTDAKPRLKWTPELHQRFVDAANHLGGPDKATPKSLMRMMGIPGLTLYHLKSHLQKYRLGKNQQSQISRDSKRSDTVDCEESCSMNELNLFCEGNEVNDAPEEQIQENGHIADTIQMQMEVQRKLHEQIEVQRHLQLRIEAQGKYLQKVLKKAHETISGYNCSADGVEHAKAELSQLVSMVSTPSFSEITETTDLSLDNLDQKFKLRRTGCSVESSVTSSESSDKIDDERDTAKISHESGPFILPLLDKPIPRGLSSKKRSRSTICEGNFVKQKCSKKSKGACIDEMGPGLTKFGLLETFDLNSQCELDLDLGPKQPIIDLNSKVHI